MTYSIEELQKMLEERTALIKELAKERDEALKKLRSIDDQIEKLSGRPVEETIKRVEIPRSARTKKKASKKTVVDFAQEVLRKHPTGLDLEALADAVIDAGYETTSTNFKGTLYQALFKNKDIFHRNGQGKYKLG